MKDLYEYVKWRGDLSFRVAPFTNIDGLIFALISYVQFDTLLEMGKQHSKIYLSQMGEQYQKQPDLNLEIAMIQENVLFFKEAAKTKRFGEVLVKNYCNMIDTARQLQFSAMELELPDGTIAISYRGTDDTLVGWIEDLNMSHLPVVPSQEEAVRFLLETQKYKLKKIRLMGHSKGGNLAVYASVHSTKWIQRRILNIYNFDGPGFLPEEVSSVNYQNMLPRMKTFAPKTSIIGRLLWQQSEPRIINSTEVGIFQHDPFSWKLHYLDFVYVEKFDKSSMILEETIRSWLEKLEPDKRKQFITIIFSLFTEKDITSIKQFKTDKMQLIKELLNAYGSLEQRDRKMLQETINLLLGEVKTSLKNNLKRK